MGALGLLLASGLALAAKASDEPPPAAPLDQPVSTRPAPDEDARTVAVTGTTRPAEAGALTRAALRRRLETLSPVDWLDRYGPVEIRRLEAD